MRTERAQRTSQPGWGVAVAPILRQNIREEPGSGTQAFPGSSSVPGTETKELEVPKQGQEVFPEDPGVQHRKQGTPRG